MNYIYLTGHEHLYDIGLINMNGRMYNPLKYVDPSGEQCYGHYESGYYLEQMERVIRQTACRNTSN